MSNMNKVKLLLVAITIGLVIVGCGGNHTPDDWRSCETRSDCENKSHICVEKTCVEDSCRGTNCGKGVCIADRTGYHCECEENAVIPQGSKICVPTCDSYSEECTEFGLRCNMEKGHCDEECQGVGSCQDGYICQSGRCWLKTD